MKNKKETNFPALRANPFVIFFFGLPFVLLGIPFLGISRRLDFLNEYMGYFVLGSFLLSFIIFISPSMFFMLEEIDKNKNQGKK